MLRCPPYEKKKGPGVKKAHARTKILKFCKRLEPRGLNLIHHLTNLNLVHKKKVQKRKVRRKKAAMKKVVVKTTRK